MRNNSIFLVLLVLVFAGCQGGPPGQMPPAGEEGDSGLVGQLTPYGTSAYIAVTHEGTYYDDHIVLYYLLQDEGGYPASDRKYGCVRLTDYPSDFNGELLEYTYTQFDNGLITVRIDTKVVGTYTFEFCGIMDPPGDDIAGVYANDNSYVGNGDPIEVEVSPYYFAVVDKKGEYTNGKLFVEYQLQSESSAHPGIDKTGCIDLVDYPKDYEPLVIGILGDFDENGIVKRSISADVPGNYTFEFCGIYAFNENYSLIDMDDWLDDKTYFGDGDAVTIEIKPSNVFYVYNKSCETWGGPGIYGYECRWRMRFLDESSGVCEAPPFVKDWELCYSVYDASEEEYKYGCWQPLNCVGKSVFIEGSYDYLKIRGSVNAADTLSIWIEGVNSSRIVYQGDGDEITIETPGAE